MRLDVGEYFSKHRAVAVTVAQLKEMNSQDEPAHAIDLSSDVIISNQLFWNGEYLACGFDAYCVFKNPFAGVNVVVTFKSTIDPSHGSPNNSARGKYKERFRSAVSRCSKRI